MLARSMRKVPSSLVLILVLLAFLVWRVSQDSSYVALSPSSVPVEAEIKSPRVAIMTFVTEQRSYLYLSLKNRDHYARRHGYDLIVDYEAHADRGVMWWKFAMAERLIKTGKYDWIWWMDFDTLITNTDIKVTDIIEEELRNVTNPNEIDYLFTLDCNGLNAGSFLVRGHERSLKFMQDAVNIHNEATAVGEPISEQGCMAKLMKDDSISTSKFHIVPQWKLNAFPPEITCTDDSRLRWVHGFFVLHFAGAWAYIRGDDPTGQLMNKYENDIIWGDWKEIY